MNKVYAPYVDALMASIGRYARDARERASFARRLADYVHGSAMPGVTLLQELSFRLRSHAQPLDAPTPVGMHAWSAG
jgi:hypothetical protein